MNKDNNQVTIAGEVVSKFLFSHEVYGEGFYTTDIRVRRESGIDDVIPVMISERLMDVTQDYTGRYMAILGQFRSFNHNEGEKRKLKLTVFAIKVGESVSKKVCDLGVVICGSGDGVCISANKVKGIRCICAKDKVHVERARQHVNINVLALAAEETKVDEAYEMLQTFINTKFLEGRYEERTKLIDEYEKRK